jgi:hypothetical protein
LREDPWRAAAPSRAGARRGWRTSPSAGRISERDPVRWALLAGAVLVAAVALLACDRAGPHGPRAPGAARDEETYVVRGAVERVEPAYDGTNGSAAPRALTVRGASGYLVTVQVGGSVDVGTWTLLHLEDHRRRGQAVVLAYRNQGTDLVAVALDE